MKTLNNSMANVCFKLWPKSWPKSWLVFCASILMVLITVGMVSQAHAEMPPFGPPVQNVPGLTLTGLEAYQGKFLTVLYAHAWAPAIKTNNRQILVQQILKQESVQITQDSMQFAPAEVAASGIFSFNHVFLVVHDQPEFAWKNANDTESQAPANEFVALKVLSKGDIDQLVFQQGNPESIVIPIR